MGATRRRTVSSFSNASRGVTSIGRVSTCVDITWWTWVNRSTRPQSSSVTTPTGLPSTTTNAARCARLGIRASASATVWCGSRVIGVSKTRSRAFTHSTTSATTRAGMSCGMTARPPRRATVSAIRRPDTAVMLATTSGNVVPVPSSVERSTSSREATSEWRGTMKTSS